MWMEVGSGGAQNLNNLNQKGPKQLYYLPYSLHWDYDLFYYIFLSYKG